MSVVIRRSASCVLAVGLVLAAPGALAITFDVGDVSGTLNTTLTAGAGWRMKDRSVNLVGKANLNPGVCGGVAQSCQGLFSGQVGPARTLYNSPGQAFLNADDGNWNYDKGDLTQAVFKVTQDIKLTWGEYGFFGKWLYFYDFVNNDFDEFHPNWITATNRESVGCTTDAPNGCKASGFDRAYGPGLPTYRKRTDPETLRQIGTDLQLFDYYVFGSFNMPLMEDKSVTFKLGNQTLNWGESTVLVINSLNQVNPLNVNNFTRVGFDLSELFTPTGMLFLSTEVYEGITVEGYYGYQWKPLEIPAYGSFFSFADLGTYGAHDWGSISFGGPAEDPDVCGSGAGTNGAAPANSQYDYSNPKSGCGTPLNNPLSGLTGTSTTIRRLADNEPSNQGQFGIAFKYFAEWLNNGTELGFYFMNYHSKLPYVSFYSTSPSCARAEGNANNAETTNFATLIANCPDLPLTAGSDHAAARQKTSNAVPIDTVRYFVEYPENIQMFGMSFNTTVGDISLQGELSYRPNLPVQIDLQDLTFLALQPMLTRCHRPTAGCEGTNSGAGQFDGNAYGSSDFHAYPGSGYAANAQPYKDTFDLLIGAGVGSARSFPSFIGAYRGITAGEETPNTYIQGWERFNVWQTDLGATYIQGATDNSIGADQVIWLFEWGMQYVPDLPGTEELQVESPGTWYHASAGADGSGTGNYKQDCANTIDCNYSGIRPDGSTFGTANTVNGTANVYGDGLRFNPHQQDPDSFANAQNWSTGVAVVNLTRYESVFPGISFAPITIFQWGVKGTSVDVANQFTEGKKQIIFNFETRYKESLSFYLGHVWFTGGGDANLQGDRNQLFTYVKYLF